MTLDEIQQLSADDMAAVNQHIFSQLSSDVALINQLGIYIVNSGGKRLRPLLAVLAARALGYQGTQHLSIAAIVEFIHTSTLLHDDVVDESTMRRGKETANALFGNQASVLVGDFLYSRSFQMMVELNNMRVMQVLANATNIIAEGEVLQLMNINDPTTTEENYLQVIYCKTAKLFEAATQLAAIIAAQPDSVEQAMKAYGMHLGTAFQLIDDVLDYQADAAELGKNIGDDLAEGKPTLPLIHAMRHGSAIQQQLISDAITERNGMQHLPEIMAALHETGAFDYTRQLAQQEALKAQQALAELAPSPFKQALVALADIAVSRSH
ncbi:octaprenyl diphosphate synthase [Alishewanella sp. 16-MA]|uniref:Octaprenyl diphosphate synthase n=1 Tax=Alishewanella maricola TaxID=2795740 RepID=A0ABS8C720_9ALTE|nr:MULTISPECIES: octaprenyl diphosphate synthase [Gammaproteobacteria]MDP4944650.1 octaprenyl diphosphate synthase [Alishewanella sp.]MCB5227925.1 octaprenyl diphosphate synthase [Alishewanella maricola]MCF4010473.1 octaprenyl diphosphate synthase [Rheinheimera sp. UJ63]MDP5034866.1 octaprenyl diphosphate synthase [Alishewanella sp.]MDP5186191.1 octaprenyl diphosphate synthase [Alishewanella sp.]